MVSNHSHSSIAWTAPTFDKTSSTTAFRTLAPLLDSRTHASPYKLAVLILFEGREATRTLLYAEHLRWLRLTPLCVLYRQEADLGQIGSKYNTNTIRKGLLPFFMGRPTKPIHERKVVASFTLKPSTVQILDFFVGTRGASRSEIVDRMIQREGLGAGITELETHLTPFQKWKGNACPPQHKLGMCQHSHCQSVYKKEGLI
jgi:hypothetical protein